MNAASVRNVAHALQSESKDRAKRIARDLFGDVPYGAEQLTKKEFLAMVQRNWPDPGYRQGLLTRIGPEKFLAAAQDAGVIGDWQPALDAQEAQS